MDLVEVIKDRMLLGNWDERLLGGFYCTILVLCVFSCMTCTFTSLSDLFCRVYGSQTNLTTNL